MHLGIRPGTAPPVGFVGVVIFMAVDLGPNFESAAAAMLMGANEEEDERHSTHAGLLAARSLL